MKGKYVLSRSEFKTQQKALNRIKKWDEDDEFEHREPHYIYKVVKKYQPYKVWKLKEVK